VLPHASAGAEERGNYARDVNPVGVAVSVVLLLAVTVGVLRWARVPIATSAIVALARGAGQLAVVSLVLGVALAHAWAGVAILAVMIMAAIATATGRLRDFPGALVAVSSAIVSGVAVTLVTIFGTGAFDLDVRYALAFAGIVIGGSMTSSSTTGRQLWIGMVHRADEIEGWLALGATPRQSVVDIARFAVTESMRPAIDQTKTTGLVAWRVCRCAAGGILAHRRGHFPGHRFGRAPRGAECVGGDDGIPARGAEAVACATQLIVQSGHPPHHRSSTLRR
jgi:putative ABC transport system permease protein